MPNVELAILRRRSFAGGHEFGSRGAYERLDIQATVMLDREQELQRGTFDAALAVAGEDGRIRVTSDLFLLVPADRARGNGACLFELPNRGNKRCLQFFNDAPGTNDPRDLHHAGNGFLMRHGYSVVCAAWQGDVLPGDGRLICDVPPLRLPDGSAPRAVVRAEFISDIPGVTCMSLSGKNGTRSYPAVSLDRSKAELRRRRYPGSRAEVIARDRWRFARVEGGGRASGAGDVTGAEKAIVPSRRHLYLEGGFEPGWIYELVYEATDPIALDFGFAAIREVAAFLRHEQCDANPLWDPSAGLPLLYGWGRSQSGRGLRDFIHRGFNQDVRGRKVFDGVISHVAGAGRTAMHRFSNLVVAASRQYEDHLNPSDRFPFSYARSVDHLTGEEGAILQRPDTDPLVIHTQTASEYWYRRGSLVHTDTKGRDLEQPDGVRIYFWSSSQHWADPLPATPQRGICTNHQNVVATSALFRGTLALLHAWARDGVAPPPSRHPHVDDITLVTAEAWREQFPAIPGVALPSGPNALCLIDYGADFAAGGAAAETPMVDRTKGYPVLVPAVDADGNDVAGIRAPMVTVPLGTYTGWNLRIRGHGAGALHDFSGSYIPLPETPEERAMTGDPRASITERHPDAEAYREAIRLAATQLADEGFILAEDVDRIAAAAADWGRPRHLVNLPGEDREACA